MYRSRIRPCYARVTLTGEKLRVAEEKQANLQEMIGRLRSHLDRVGPLLESIHSSSSALEGTLHVYPGVSVVDPPQPPSKQNLKSLEDD